MNGNYLGTIIACIQQGRLCRLSSHPGPCSRAFQTQIPVRLVLSARAGSEPMADKAAKHRRSTSSSAQRGVQQVVYVESGQREPGLLVLQRQSLMLQRRACTMPPEAPRPRHRVNPHRHWPPGGAALTAADRCPFVFAVLFTMHPFLWKRGATWVCILPGQRAALACFAAPSSQAPCTGLGIAIQPSLFMKRGVPLTASAPHHALLMQRPVP